MNLFELDDELTPEDMGMMEDPDPTESELIMAVTMAKAKGFKSGELKHGDGPVAYLRSCLGPAYAAFPLDRLRMLVERLSKAGKEPGENKRTPEEKESKRIVKALELITKDSTRSVTHSAEYAEIHANAKYKQLRDDLKRRRNFRCQLCCRVRISSYLEGHILDYKEWWIDGNLLILCADGCHEIMDAVRRLGITTDNDAECNTPLFNL